MRGLCSFSCPVKLNFCYFLLPFVFIKPLCASQTTHVTAWCIGAAANNHVTLKHKLQMKCVIDILMQSADL